MTFSYKIERQIGSSKLNAVLKHQSNHIYELLEPFNYSIRYKGNTYEFVIPKGFLTNFASVPRPFWSLFHPLDERMLVASCVHDYVLNENSHLQPNLLRIVKIDGMTKQISDCIDGFLAADLFFFSLSQEGSYTLPVRQVLRMFVKGYYSLTLKGWVRV